MQRVALLLPVALLAALISVQTFGEGVDARAAGLGAAVVALVLRAPFLVVVSAAAVTARAACERSLVGVRATGARRVGVAVGALVVDAVAGARDALHAHGRVRGRQARLVFGGEGGRDPAARIAIGTSPATRRPWRPAACRRSPCREPSGRGAGARTHAPQATPASPRRRLPRGVRTVGLQRQPLGGGRLGEAVRLPARGQFAQVPEVRDRAVVRVLLGLSRSTAAGPRAARRARAPAAAAPPTTRRRRRASGRPRTPAGKRAAPRVRPRRSPRSGTRPGSAAPRRARGSRAHDLVPRRLTQPA